MSARRFSSFPQLHRQYAFDPKACARDFDPDYSDTVIAGETTQAAILQVDDPVIRADVIAEQTDHAPLTDDAQPRPTLVRLARDAGCWVFDLFAPDVAGEKPMSDERRAAMHSDRETLKTLAVYTAMVVCAGLFCWSALQISINLWQLFGVAWALS